MQIFIRRSFRPPLRLGPSRGHKTVGRVRGKLNRRNTAEELGGKLHRTRGKLRRRFVWVFPRFSAVCRCADASRGRRGNALCEGF